VTGRFALAALGVVALFLGHAWYLGGVAEDAFISFRFARNLVEGHGLVWNPGEARVEGYTNFSWVVLSALAQRFGLDAIRSAQALGLAASLATLWVVHFGGVRVQGWPLGLALLPCVFLALAGPFATWATGGLETNAFAFCVVAGVVAFGCFWRGERAGAATASFGMLCLAALTRPEGILAWALVAALAWLASRGRPEARRRLALPAAASLLLYLLYFAWRWNHFGYPFPNTFYAKTGDSLAQLDRGARYAGFFLLHYGLAWLPLLVLAARSPRTGKPTREVGLALGARVRSEPLLVAAAVLALGLAAAVVWEGGDYMAMYRFFVPVAPLLALLCGAALVRAARAAKGAPRRAAFAGAVACAALGTVFHSTPLEAVLPGPPRMHGNWRGVQTERWHVARLSAIGRFFGREGRPGESLATDAIGATGWYSGLAVHGAHGLVDPDVAHARRAGSRVGQGVAGHDRLDFQQLFARRPTFVMFRRELRERKLQRLELNVEVDPAIAAEYELSSVWLEDPGNGEAGWFPYLVRRDRDAR